MELEEGGGTGGEQYVPIYKRVGEVVRKKIDNLNKVRKEVEDRRTNYGDKRGGRQEFS